jgi:hypothetical protein
MADNLLLNLRTTDSPYGGLQLVSGIQVWESGVPGRLSGGADNESQTSKQ